VGKLETRCEELQRLLDEARMILEKQQQQQRRRRERRKSSQNRTQTNNNQDQEDEDPGSTGSSHQDISDTESDDRLPSSIRNRESGYSSGSVESHLHRLQDSDSELSSPDHREQMHLHSKSSEISMEDDVVLEKLKLDKLELEERLAEMERVVSSLQLENRRLQTMYASQCSQDSLRSVDDEVLEVHDVR
jgi:hypothetical protein